MIVEDRTDTYQIVQDMVHELLDTVGGAKVADAVAAMSIVLGDTFVHCMVDGLTEDLARAALEEQIEAMTGMIRRSARVEIQRRFGTLPPDVEGEDRD